MKTRVLTGIGVSVGIAIGSAYFLSRQRFQQTSRQTISEELVDNERLRLQQAFADSLNELRQIKERVPNHLQEHGAILDAHLMILQDEKFKESAYHYITELRLNAEWALEKAVADIAKMFSIIEDEYIRERVQDVRLVAERVLNKLLGQEAEILKPIKSRVILLAHDLTPADTIELEVDKIMGFATAMGGKTSHAGILARSLQIPAIVGMADLEDSIHDNSIIILDGFHGRIIIDPTEDELAEYTEMSLRFEDYQASITRSAYLPALTLDNYQINVLANIELFEEITAVLDNGGEGVGLYRTEYSYMGSSFPTEEELFEQYRDMADLLNSSKVVIRTLDLGADKVSSIIKENDESNPALGLRAVRFCMKHKDLFKTQLRAILRASVYGNVSIMFPMISGLQELWEVKQIYKDVQDELWTEGKDFNANMPVGAMIELPSAVFIAESLAKEVDFFSIGTNDLIQYSLGIDRTNSQVSYLYQPLHPAILRSIKLVVDAAKNQGIEVCVCGEMASDPFCIPVLMGMEIDSISLNPQSIPGIKRIIRHISLKQCQQLLQQIINSDTVYQNNQLVKDNIFKEFPEEMLFYSSLLGEE